MTRVSKQTQDKPLKFKNTILFTGFYFCSLKYRMTDVTMMVHHPLYSWGIPFRNAISYIYT